MATLARGGRASHCLSPPPSGPENPFYLASKVLYDEGICMHLGLLKVQAVVKVPVIEFLSPAPITAIGHL